MKKFKFYIESFNINKMYPTPPNREYNIWPLFGKIQTRDSKRQHMEYLFRIDEWKDKIKCNVSTNH